ncbi:MAG: tRNA (cytidine(34)-2'-O)-methyltransferase [Gammaproteobacteria bacterium]
MFHVVLFEPEIAPNTGNIIRLCANTGANLHLIKPLGFRLDDRKLKRAGLDYLARTCMTVHESLENCLAELRPAQIHAFSTKGRHVYHEARYQPGDVLIFGPETRGLPESLLSEWGDNVVRIPMRAGERSLNLSNSVAIGLYEAWRQNDFS